MKNNNNPGEIVGSIAGAVILLYVTFAKILPALAAV
jgi:hypothetical protein